MANEFIKTENQDGVLVLTMHDPPTRNALGLEMAKEIVDTLDEFENDAIGAYFDVGNIVNYGWPEHWIAALGHRILKLDIKEYSRSRRDNEGLWKGFQVKIGDGDCDWPAVRRALKTIDYHGWATAEVPGGDQLRLQEVAERMNKVLALT